MKSARNISDSDDPDLLSACTECCEVYDTQFSHSLWAAEKRLSTLTARAELTRLPLSHTPR